MPEILISYQVGMYLRAIAGQYPLLFFILYFGGLAFMEGFIALRIWFLGRWALQYDYLPPDQVNVVL
jgi:hypothetical protein